MPIDEAQDVIRELTHLKTTETNAIITKMRYPWILIVLIVIQLSLSACAIVPYYSHYNVKANPYRELNRSPKAPSGAYLASEDVQWRVNWQCRANWQFDRNVSSLNPLDACPTDDNNFIGIAQ